MTYRDEIVDEVRAIREQLCNRAGSLENLLATLRAEETDHAGRMAKDLNENGKIPKSGLYRANQKSSTDDVNGLRSESQSRLDETEES